MTFQRSHCVKYISFLNQWKIPFLKCQIFAFLSCWSDSTPINVLTLYLFLSFFGHFYSSLLSGDSQSSPVSAHYFWNWCSAGFMCWRRHDWMLGNILLKPIFMLPLQSGELVNSWCLVGCADSQGDKDKSWALLGEQRRLESIGKLWCSRGLCRIYRIFSGFVPNKISSCFVILLLTFLSISFDLCSSY